MSGSEVRLERTFDAPREAVFEAWTSPEVMRRWWAAGSDWETLVAEVDLRPGGRIRVLMAESGGEPVHAFSGEFVEVCPPERLVYTMAWEGPGSYGTVTTVTVEFHRADGDRTTVLLIHSGLASDWSREAHEGGWNATLDNLEKRVFPTGRHRKEAG
jgi:uncharacterized protein YndB with AHSA1/START domain